MKTAENKEIWKDIPGYEGYYQASNLGRIKSLGHYSKVQGRVLSPHINAHNGYVYVSLSKDNHRLSKRVHKLVMIAFSEQPKDKPQINHINGNKADNRLVNLEWCNASENMKHAYQTGLEIPKGREVIDLDTLVVYPTATSAVNAIFGQEKPMPIIKVCQGERSHYKERHFAYYEDYLKDTIPTFKGKTKRRSSYSLWVDHNEKKDIGAN